MSTIYQLPRSMVLLPVSVVLPLYNKAPFVRRALDSIAAQTFRDFEVIVVNDGSIDGGEALAEAYPDPRFRTIHQANAGPGAARNRGVAEAKGLFIAFLDADDEWLPEYLERSLEFIKATGSEAVSVTSSYFEFPGGLSTEPMWRARGLRQGLFRLNQSTPAMQFVRTLAFISPCSTVVRADVFNRWGGFYEHRCVYGEDADLWLKILLNETVAFQLDAPLVRFHREASDLSDSRMRDTPIEPFLDSPERIESVCPPQLRLLLGDALAIRAFKRACVLGYWGKWREAAELRRRFVIPGCQRLPYWAPALLAGTPLAPAVGWPMRVFR